MRADAFTRITRTAHAYLYCVQLHMRFVLSIHNLNRPPSQVSSINTALSFGASLGLVSTNALVKIECATVLEIPLGKELTAINCLIETPTWE